MNKSLKKKSKKSWHTKLKSRISGFYKNHPIIYSGLLSVVTSLLGFIVAFFLPNGIESLNEHGFHFAGLDFTTFDYHQFDRFESEYWYPDQKRQFLVVGNSGRIDLLPRIEVNPKPNDPEIRIICKEQTTGRNCYEGFYIEQGKLATLEFKIDIGTPKQKEYNLCIKTIDTRIGREENYRERCKDIVVREKPTYNSTKTRSQEE